MYVQTDAERNWQNFPPREPVDKVLLRWLDEDTGLEYMLCHWVWNNEGVLWLVDYEYENDVPFNTGDQWIKLES